MKHKDDIESYAEKLRRIIGNVDNEGLEVVAVKIAKVLDEVYSHTAKIKTSEDVSYGRIYLDYLKTALGLTTNTPFDDPYFYLMRGIKGVGEIAKKVYDDHSLDMIYKKLTQ